MSLDLEQDDPIDYDSDEDGGCEDFGDLGLPAQRVVHNVGRSLDEIMELEVQIIQECTDVDPSTWIQIYASKYRAIMDVDSSGTKSQIKRKLYIND